MRTSPPIKPPSLLRRAIEAEQKRSPQVTPLGLVIALSVAITIGATAVMVSS